MADDARFSVAWRPSDASVTSSWKLAGEGSTLINRRTIRRARTPLLPPQLVAASPKKTPSASDTRGGKSPTSADSQLTSPIASMPTIGSSPRVSRPTTSLGFRVKTPPSNGVIIPEISNSRRSSEAAERRLSAEFLAAMHSGSPRSATAVSRRVSLASLGNGSGSSTLRPLTASPVIKRRKPIAMDDVIDTVSEVRQALISALNPSPLELQDISEKHEQRRAWVRQEYIQEQTEEREATLSASITLQTCVRRVLRSRRLRAYLRGRKQKFIFELGQLFLVWQRVMRQRDGVRRVLGRRFRKWFKFARWHRNTKEKARFLAEVWRAIITKRVLLFWRRKIKFVALSLWNFVGVFFEHWGFLSRLRSRAMKFRRRAERGFLSDIFALLLFRARCKKLVRLRAIRVGHHRDDAVKSFPRLRVNRYTEEITACFRHFKEKDTVLRKAIGTLWLKIIPAAFDVWITNTKRKNSTARSRAFADTRCVSRAVKIWRESAAILRAADALQLSGYVSKSVENTRQVLAGETVKKSLHFTSPVDETEFENGDTPLRRRAEIQNLVYYVSDKLEIFLAQGYTTDSGDEAPPRPKQKTQLKSPSIPPKSPAVSTKSQPKSQPKSPSPQPTSGTFLTTKKINLITPAAASPRRPSRDSTPRKSDVEKKATTGKRKVKTERKEEDTQMGMEIGGKSADEEARDFERKLMHSDLSPAEQERLRLKFEEAKKFKDIAVKLAKSKALLQTVDQKMDGLRRLLAKKENFENMRNLILGKTKHDMEIFLKQMSADERRVWEETKRLLGERIQKFISKLENVYVQVRWAWGRFYFETSFRVLCSPVLVRRLTRAWDRIYLTMLLKICSRHRNFENSAPNFRKTKLKFTAMRRWMRFVQWGLSHERQTIGPLSTKAVFQSDRIKSLRMWHRKFSYLLQRLNLGLSDSRFRLMERLSMLIKMIGKGSKKGPCRLFLFQWMEYYATNKSHREIVRLFNERCLRKIKRIYFVRLRTNLRGSNQPQELRYAIVQITHEIDKWKVLFFSEKLFSVTLRKALNKHLRAIRLEAKTTPNVSGLVRERQSQIEKRISIETKAMLDFFDKEEREYTNISSQLTFDGRRRLHGDVGGFPPELWSVAIDIRARDIARAQLRANSFVHRLVRRQDVFGSTLVAFKLSSWLFEGIVRNLPKVDQIAANLPTENKEWRTYVKDLMVRARLSLTLNSDNLVLDLVGT